MKRHPVFFENRMIGFYWKPPQDKHYVGQLELTGETFFAQTKKHVKKGLLRLFVGSTQKEVKRV